MDLTPKTLEFVKITCQQLGNMFNGNHELILKFIGFDSDGDPVYLSIRRSMVQGGQTITQGNMTLYLGKLARPNTWQASHR